MATGKRNHEKGLIVTIATTLVAGIVLKLFGNWMLHPFVGTLLALLGVTLCVLYFGFSGLRTVPVGFQGIGLWFEERVEGEIYSEGLIWNWPTPFGDIIIVDTRDKPIDLPLTEVLTADTVPISITISLQIKVTDLYTYLNADNPEELLKNAVESDVRSIALILQSGNIAQEKQTIIKTMLTGQGGDNTPLEGLLLQGLSHSKKLWGITVSQVNIQNIRLPKVIESAHTETQVQVANQRKEVAQAVAEKIEARHIAEMMAIYKDAGLSPTEAMNMLQTERGKATRIILDGAADPLVKAGALAGGILGKS